MQWLNLQLCPTTAQTTGLNNSAHQYNTKLTQEQDSTTVYSYTVRMGSTGRNNRIYQFSGDITDERQNLAPNTNKDLTKDRVCMSCFAVPINLLLEETNQLLEHI